jgi:hypothetical protein
VEGDLELFKNHIDQIKYMSTRYIDISASLAKSKSLQVVDIYKYFCVYPNGEGVDVETFKNALMYGNFLLFEYISNQTKGLDEALQTIPNVAFLMRHDCIFNYNKINIEKIKEGKQKIREFFTKKSYIYGAPPNFNVIDFFIGAVSIEQFDINKHTVNWMDVLQRDRFPSLRFHPQSLYVLKQILDNSPHMDYVVHGTSYISYNELAYEILKSFFYWGDPKNIAYFRDFLKISSQKKVVVFLMVLHMCMEHDDVIMCDKLLDLAKELGEYDNVLDSWTNGSKYEYTYSELGIQN